MGDVRFTVDDARHLVVVTATGELSAEEGKAAITRARTVAAERSCATLYDVRRVTMRLRPIEWFTVPRELPVLTRGATRFVRAAILIAPGQRDEDDYRFYETVAGNRGQQLRVFDDEGEALAWLRRGDGSTSDSSA